MPLDPIEAGKRINCGERISQLLLEDESNELNLKINLAPFFILLKTVRR